MRSFRLRLLLALLLGMALFSPPSAQATPAGSGPWPGVSSVLVVSIDGLTPAALRRLGPASTPVLHRLIASGASTMNARSSVEQTVTLPNHTTMITGRRINRAVGGHGVTWNDDRLTPATVQAAAGREVSSVFSTVHDAGESTAMFASKTKFSLFERSWPGALDKVSITLDTDALANQLSLDLVTTPRAMRFWHIASPDSAGHATGWMSPAYLRAVRRSDRQLGQVLRTIATTPSLTGRVLVVVTADHGGLGRGHSNPRTPADYRIPFIVHGPGVASGADLYALNPALTNPRAGRPAYGERRQPVRNGQVANLVTDALGLTPVPGSEFGTLSVG